MLLLAGLGAIAYSYVGSLITLAGDVERSVRRGDDESAFSMVVSFLLGGEIPQLTGFLYLGLLLIAVAVVTLMMKGEKRDE